MNIIKKNTPNKAPRVEAIKYIIIHATWMADDAEAMRWWMNPAKEISPHYFIDAEAKLYQFVEDNEVAWHAGISQWKDDVNLNGCSLGIEISNPDEHGSVPYTEAQYAALNELLKILMVKHDILPENILAHSAIAPGRKTDPGEHFDWSKLAQ